MKGNNRDKIAFPTLPLELTLICLRTRHTCDPQLCQVDARACKHTTTMVTPLQTNKIHVMRCNPLKDRQTECNYTAIKSRFIYATTRNVD